jgi:glutathione synthase
MKMLFVMDPIESINIKKDTTFAFMLEAQSRGWEVHYTTQPWMGAGADGPFCRSAALSVRHVIGDHFERGDFERRRLDDFDVIWMRKDPPVDMRYIHTTHLLDLVDTTRTLVLNRPSALRAANEKTFILNFPDCTPRTIVAADAPSIRSFLQDVGGKAVIKPLDRMGGSGIFVLRQGDPNLGSILEAVTNYGEELVMVQAFVPEAAEGDKRILLWDGEPLGAILRVPQGDDFRGNLAAGGRAVATDITDADQRIIDAVRERAVEDGLSFVGLDVIGGRMTEFNVTSPTGIPEMNALGGLHVEGVVMDRVVEKLETTRRARA